MEYRLCRLWPDALNANGSQGNVLCLRRRMEWRGYEVSVTDVNRGESADFSDFDLVCIGGGKLDDPALFSECEKLSAPLRAYLEEGGALFAVCEGFELLAEKLTLSDGAERAGLALAPFDVRYGKDRLTGNLLFSFDGAAVAAFENHAGRITLRDGAAPLGKLLSGYGNNGEDGSVGLRERNLFACAACGPLLPRNPALADAVLAASLLRRHAGETLAPLDDSAERAAFDELAAKIK